MKHWKRKIFLKYEKIEEKMCRKIQSEGGVQQLKRSYEWISLEKVGKIYLIIQLFLKYIFGGIYVRIE